ncbi:MAG: sodium/proline symporter [Alphaproteobacteria bacterium]|jgi:sodium/proline symporter
MLSPEILPYTITLCVYIFILFGIGIVGYFTTSDLSDYILGGRKMGMLVTALSAGASDMSGWLLMGLPGAILTHGLSQSWIAVGLFLGSYLNWTFIAGKIRTRTEALGNAQTIPEYFANRFPQKASLLRGFSSIVILVFFTLYCAAGIVAAARLLELTFQMDYTYAAILGSVITVFYILIGGFFAVSWTDTFQAVLIFLALILVPCVAYFNIVDYDQAVQQISSNSSEYLSFFKDFSLFSMVSALAWGLGYFGQPHILVRFMAAADSGETIRKARLVGLIWMGICLLGALMVGYFGALYLQSSGNAIEVDENIFLELGRLLFNPWIAGILIAAVLSAVMSTLSSQLLLCSSAVVGDLLPLFKVKLEGNAAIQWGRVFLILTAIAATILALSPKNSILSIVGEAWSGFGSAFGPLVILSLYRNDITANGAIAGIISGAMISLGWESLFGSDIYSLIPGFIGSALVIMLISKLNAKATGTNN